jgi:peptide/nickel transport system substrate-binding protein
VPCSTLLRGEAGALVSANGTGQSAGWGSFGIYSDPVRPSQLARERRSATSATKAARGIRARLRQLERAAFFKGYAEKQYKNLIMGGSGAFGNAATRLEAMAVKGGTYAYGSYPDLDEMFKQQGAELDQKKRGAILEKMQQIVNERTMFAPIWQLAFINGHGPRVGESGFGLIPGFAYTGPYEDITLKSG